MRGIGALRLLLICGSIALVSPLAPGQASSPKVDIYSVALVEAAKEMRKSWHLTGGWQVYSDWSAPGEFPAMSGDIRFEYRTLSELHARRKKTGEDFPVLGIHPATVEGTRVKVHISQDVISLWKGRPAVGISAWAEVFFKVNAQNGQFEIDEVKLGGI